MLVYMWSFQVWPDENHRTEMSFKSIFMTLDDFFSAISSRDLKVDLVSVGIDVNAV